MSFHDDIRMLEEGVPFDEKEDHFIKKLTPEELEEYMEIVNINIKGISLMRELQKLRKRCEAKHTLFWDDIAMSNEIAESAEARGRKLAVRKRGEDWVLVDVDDQPQGNVIMMNLIDLIKRMQEGGEE